jgi:hypothetical protein
VIELIGADEDFEVYTTAEIRLALRDQLVRLAKHRSILAKQFPCALIHIFIAPRNIELCEKDLELVANTLNMGAAVLIASTCGVTHRRVLVVLRANLTFKDQT